VLVQSLEPLNKLVHSDDAGRCVRDVEVDVIVGNGVAVVMERGWGRW
jgi:hypothetical protein